MPAPQKFTRRNPDRKRKTQNLITIPPGVGPHVRLVFAEMHRQRVTYDELEAGSGVLRGTVKAWRTKNKAGLESIECTLGFLGFDFVPVPRAKVLPAEVVGALQPIADQLQMSMPQAIEAVISVIRTQRGNVPHSAADLGGIQ